MWIRHIQTPASDRAIKLVVGQMYTSRIFLSRAIEELRASPFYNLASSGIMGAEEPLNSTLREKAEALPAQPGVYVFKDENGQPIYVGKAKSLRARVRSYFLESRPSDDKRDLMLDAAHDLETILVDNEHEAMALENNLIKQYKPRYNILLRDDKSYPYIKFTAHEKFPRVYVTRRVKKDGSIYYGPYFPANLAYRIVDFIHRHFLVPSCYVDLTRHHPRPCLQFYIKRCLGPCVENLTLPERYAEAARDTRLLLEGRESDLVRSLHGRMVDASNLLEFEDAARYRDQIGTVEELRERQKMAANSGEEADILGFHQEGPLVAVNLFHLRGGRVLDRREFFWEDLEEFNPPEFFSTLLKQVYLDQQYLPGEIHAPVDFDDRETLEELLSQRRGRPIHILTPQAGPKRALLELVARNARHSFERRFRILTPQTREVLDSLTDALDLRKPPNRIEAFDVSHIQGTDIVASMVVWEAGKMKKSDYRKFIIKSVPQNDDFASMKEVVGRRYRRLQEEKKAFPDLVLIDGGVGQLHAAGAALEELGIINQAVASIAKREEILYVLGRESEPVVLDHHSPALHLVQKIRDEAHRFAVTFHRARRTKREITTELLQIPGVGKRTSGKLLSQFGSISKLREVTLEELAQVVKKSQAKRVFEYLSANIDDVK
ncbi:MAG: excinuclease ABC subunit UvrC [Acidobacteriota bacterium]|nr:excinuclease ABC subunit UvrC [Acidobacteriota bacterium]